MLLYPERFSRDLCACPLVGKPNDLAECSTLNRWVQGPRGQRYLGAFYDTPRILSILNTYQD